MRLLRKYAFWIFLFCLVTALVSAPSPDTVRTRLADGFDQPVGKPDGVGYYTSRGFRPRYHMGEDWNGLEGGNKDLGKPVYATANGIVVLARDMRMGWGNLIIIRHIFLEDRQMRTADSAYAHLDRILVREGQQIVRGQQIGSIGTNRGMYTAHLHFEVAKKPLHWLQPERFRKGLLELLHAQLVHRSAPQAFRIGPQRPRRDQYIQLER